ncbi:hypothetical protein Cob_v003861 [Colletotrichum orbiculare MAFF 240422]|uniref:Uncharacterized protein n=1 Tax=Colletotrichum orbiculare (strain 104-T / ATCC 96160 / CBS 514.97 / LARS 414 / MAFF 240422) TaxID=1213857 RepID=A0A484G063_COLOR|nr:hypothetical protein Cob_v003861 [Colletotrichum orbiculare MAFF 240422]
MTAGKIFESTEDPTTDLDFRKPTDLDFFSVTLFLLRTIHAGFFGAVPTEQHGPREKKEPEIRGTAGFDSARWAEMDERTLGETRDSRAH